MWIVSQLNVWLILPQYCMAGCCLSPYEKSDVKVSPFPVLNQSVSMLTPQKCQLPLSEEELKAHQLLSLLSAAMSLLLSHSSLFASTCKGSCSRSCMVTGKIWKLWEPHESNWSFVNSVHNCVWAISSSFNFHILTFSFNGLLISKVLSGWQQQFPILF